MTVSLLLIMAAAILAAVVLYTFIGFIPGTGKAGVLASVTLAIILAETPPHVVLAFFTSTVATFSPMDGIPTALVGLPGGVMSAPLMDHAMALRNKGLASDAIRKMAVGSTIGTLISIPLSFLLAGLLLPVADWTKSNSDIVLTAGAVILALLGKNRILSLVSILPMALLFQALPALYRGAGIIPEKANVNTSFFLSITVGSMLLIPLELLSAKRQEALPHDNRTKAGLLRSGFERQALWPGRLITRSEGWWSAAMTAVSALLFILSPVGLTFLLGEASMARQKEDQVPRAQRAVTVMSALAHSTYLAGVIIPLVALGAPTFGVSVGLAGPLFNAGSVYTRQHNLHHLLDLPGFIITMTIEALVVVTITYVIAVRQSSQITYFVVCCIPHEAVLTLFVTFALPLAYIDTDQKAGLANVSGALLVGIACRSLNRLGVSYGVQFISPYAAPGIVKALVALA